MSSHLQKGQQRSSILADGRSAVQAEGFSEPRSEDRVSARMALSTSRRQIV